MRSPILHAAPCVAAILLAIPLSGCIAYQVKASLKFQKAAGFDGTRTVSVETLNGAIEVKCDPEATGVDISGHRSARGVTREEAEEHARRIRIEVRRDPEHPEALQIAAVVPEDERDRGYSVSFRITLPPGADLDLRGSNGKVEVSGAEGEVAIRTSNGSVTVASVDGNVRVRTSNGKVSARDVSGDVALESSNGTIRALGIRGAADLTTSNGSIELRAESVPDAPRIAARTSNGKVSVELPGTIRAELEMDTSNGSVHADIARAVASGVVDEKKMFRATLNGGGGLVTIRSSNGSVHFTAR